MKKLTNCEFKRMHKSWITQSILNSIKRKDNLFNQYVKSKDSTAKDNLHDEYKILRNKVTSMINISEKIIMIITLLNIQITLKNYGLE